MRRAFNSHGWAENTQAHLVSCSSVRWEYSDAATSVKALRPSQYYNHFPDSRELTTKQGLNKTLNSITQPGIDIYDFYPRTYDLAEVGGVEAFTADYTQTAVLACLKTHAKYFKKHCLQELI